MKRRWIWIGLVLVIMATVSFVAAGFLAGRPGPMAHDKYLAIGKGMSRNKVRRLMRGIGTVAYTGVSNAEIMDVDGRYMIVIVYEPNPSLATSRASTTGPPDDDWVAKEKVFIELGRGNPVDNLLVVLGVRPQRIFDRDRMPR